MTKGVWVKTDVIEGKLTVHPVSTVERPAYNQFLAKHFSSLDDGFFFRATRDQTDQFLCSDLFSSRGNSINYEVLSPLSNLLLTGSQSDPGKSSFSLTSSVDSDSEAEYSSDSSCILMMDQKHNCLIRISLSKESYYKNQVTRVESPPGVLLGWIQKRKNLLTANVYHLYEGTEPVEPNLILRKCSKYDVTEDDDDEEGSPHDGCFSCLFPCSQAALASNLFEIHEVVVTENKKKKTATKTEKGIGMIFGSQQVDNITTKLGNEEKITCSFNPNISRKKKVLILSSVVVIHMNRDVA